MIQEISASASTMQQSDSEKSLFDVAAVERDSFDERSPSQIKFESNFIFDLCSRNCSNFGIPDALPFEKVAPAPRVFRRYENPTTNWSCTYSDSLQDSQEATTQSSKYELNSICIVTIHGGFFDGGEWLKLESQFGANICRWVNITLPGFDGTPSTGRGSYSGGFVDTCKLINELLDHLNINKIVFLGHSFGGFIRNYFTLLYPNRIAAIGSFTTHTINWNIALRSWVECYVHPAKLNSLSEVEVRQLFKSEENQKKLCDLSIEAFKYMQEKRNLPLELVPNEKLIALMRYFASKEHHLTPIETYRALNTNIPAFVVFGKNDPLIQVERTTESQYFYLKKSNRNPFSLPRNTQIQQILKDVPNFDYQANAFYDNFVFAFDTCKHTPHLNRARELASPLRTFVKLIDHLNSAKLLKHLYKFPLL